MSSMRSFPWFVCTIFLFCGLGVWLMRSAVAQQSQEAPSEKPGALIVQSVPQPGSFVVDGHFWRITSHVDPYLAMKIESGVEAVPETNGSEEKGVLELLRQAREARLNRPVQLPRAFESQYGPLYDLPELPQQGGF